MPNDFLQLIQFSGPKRFLTSIGVILVFLSIFLPWLLISQALVFDVKTADYNQLTQISQYGVIARQSLSLALIVSSCCLSPILAFFGISFATISYWAWFFFGDSEKDKQSSKSEKGVDKSASLPKQEAQQISAPSDNAVSQIPAIASKGKPNRSIKANAYALFTEKTREILLSPNILKSQYSIESDDWFDVVLSSQSESPDILIASTHIYEKDLWNIVRFYRLLIKEWADHNERHKAKAIGVILYPKLSLLSHVFVWILNRERLLIFFKLDVNILLFAERLLDEKNILNMIQKNLPVNISSK